jgi:hypothetical protein
MDLLIAELAIGSLVPRANSNIQYGALVVLPVSLPPKLPCCQAPPWAVCPAGRLMQSAWVFNPPASRVDYPINLIPLVQEEM